MKKGLVLLMAVMLAMGLLVSCSDSGDDVEKAVQGTWLSIDVLGGGQDMKLIIGADDMVQYSVLTTDPFDVDHYTDSSEKGDMEADDGAFTFTATHSWDVGTKAWVAYTDTQTGTYVLNGNILTLTADFDSSSPGLETVDFTRQ